MKISINLIKGSTNPIRTSEDKEKMDELVQSIAQQGLIVPIKVRPVGDVPICMAHGYEALTWDYDKDFDAGDCPRCSDLKSWVYGDDIEYDTVINIPFEVVYGHRRLHACRELGLAEIECIVEGMEEGDQLIQSIIENMVREDMSDMDQAKALKALINITGWSYGQIANKGITSAQNAMRLSRLLEVPVDIQNEIGKSISKRHVSEVFSHSHGNDRDKILRKAIKENLNLPQTEKVVEAISKAETPEERKAILDTPVDNPVFDRIVRAKAKAEIERKATEAERHLGNTHEVKQFMDAMKAFEKAIHEVMEAIDYNKFSPEGIQYTLNRLEKVTESINDLTIKLMEAK